MRTRNLWSWVVVAGLALAACGGGESGGGAAGEGEPVAGGTLTFLATGEVADLFPDTGAGPVGVGYVSAADRRFALYDALAVEDPDGTVAMRLAESITSDDGSVWTVRIRAGITFSDGTPFDAAAVKFNWERVADPATKSPHAPTARAIASSEVVDPLTLRVTLTSPDAGFPRTVARSGLTFIGSPTAMRAKGAAFGSAPVGAGPFVLEEWVRDDRTVFVRNPSYHGKVYLDRLVFRPIVDENQRQNTFASGGGELNTTTDLNIVAQARSADATVNSVRTSGGYNYVFNTSKPPFDDVRARRAVSLATDAEAMHDTLYRGAGLATRSVFTEDSPFFNRDTALPGHDAAEAQRLFDELAAEGKKLSITITTPNSALAARAEWLQAHLVSRFKNVDAKVDAVPAAQYATDRRSGNFQMIVSFTRFTDPDPALYNALHSKGAENYAKYSNPEMDAALVKGHVSFDQTTRKQAYDTVQRLLARDLPYFITAGFEVFTITSKSVRGFTTFAEGVPRWDLIWKAR